MRKVISMLLASVMILSTVILGGCGRPSDPTVSKEKTAYAVVDDLSANGQKKVVNYLTDQNTNVQKIKETVEGYVKGYTNIDYKNMDGMGTYGYLNDKILQEYKSKNDAAETVKAYKDNTLITQFDSLNIDSVKITKEMDLAQVTGSYKYKYIEGKNDYLKQQGIQKGALYKADFTFQVTKQNDVWKISYIKVETATLANK